MPRPYLYLSLVVAVLLALMACNETITAPPIDGLFVDFEPTTDPDACTLSAADRTVGGERPYTLYWLASGQPATDDPSPEWTYRSGQVHEVVIRLRVTDAAATTGTTEKTVRLDCQA